MTKKEKAVVPLLTNEKYDIDKMSFHELKDVLDKTFPASEIITKFIPALMEKVKSNTSSSMDLMKTVMILQYALMLLDDLTKSELEKRHVNYN